MVGPVGPPAPVRQDTRRAGLEFAVLQDGEADPSDRQSGIIYADPASNRSRVEWIGQVAGLCPFNLFYVFDGSGVTAVITGPRMGESAALAPEIALADVVVVRDCDGRYVADDFAEIPAELEPVGVMPRVVIDLVSGEKEKIGLKLLDVLDNIGLGDVPPWPG